MICLPIRFKSFARVKDLSIMAAHALREMPLGQVGASGSQPIKHTNYSRDTAAELHQLHQT
jgi:hypothetical protein